MEGHQEARRGNRPVAADSGSAGAGAGSKRRPSVALAALASLKGLAAKHTGGSSSSIGSTASWQPTRPSQAASHRGSLASGAMASTHERGEGAEPAAQVPVASSAGTPALHLSLNCIKSFSHKRSIGRAGGRAVGFDELAAAMDTLDSRLGGVLEELRTKNSAGLGPVRGMSRSKNGKLRLAGGRDGAATAAAAAAEAEAGAGGAVQQLGQLPDSLQQLLGAESEGRPKRTPPHVQFEEPALEQTSSKTARGCLEGSEAGAAATEAGAHRPGPSEGAVTSVPYLVEPAHGLDSLGWLRNLVHFTDFKHQQQQAQQPQPVLGGGGEGSEPALALDTISWLESGAGLHPQKAAQPGTGAASSSSASVLVPQTAARSREEAVLLQAWLQDMMGQVIVQAPASFSADSLTAAVNGEGTAACSAAAGTGTSSGGATQLADAALWLYGMAFDELQRQVAAECGERGALLGAVWQHAFHLMELRVSLLYEGIIGVIREELAEQRRRSDAATAQAKAAEQQMQESMYYSRDRFAAMEDEVKRMAQLLAAADEEVTRYSEEAALLRQGIDTQSQLRAAAEERSAQEQRRRLELEIERDELAATSREHGAALSSQGTELAQLRANLQRSRAEGLALAEDRARLEVETRSAQRDFQTAEILGMSLREQLAAREAELSELSSRHGQLQADQAAATAQLLESQAMLSALQIRHEKLQAASSKQVQALEQALATERGVLAETRGQLAAVQADKQALERSLKETAAHETAVTAQLRQLAGAHEQQSNKLRQETSARHNAEDELQAVRAGLQVTQQRLEGLGLVFASGSAHRTTAEAWRATGPISMARQVVVAANQHLAELVARKTELQHELWVAKERWQEEEAVRIRLQEQLLEVRAHESKLAKEREGLEAVAARLQDQHSGQDAELSQMRKMLAQAETRCQASHKQAMESANEAKRLAPLEPRMAHLEESLHAAHAELDQAQREVAAHQSSIRKLLEEKSMALEQLAARNQALDAAQLQIRELGAASRDRVELAGDKAKLEEELRSLHQRCSATQRLQDESMHQLTVARRLLTDAHGADEHRRLQMAETELQGAKLAVAAHQREFVLLKDRLLVTQEQLEFMERQLEVAVHSPLAAAVAAAAPGTGAASTALLQQLRRLLETKEERIRQLERVQSSLLASTSQLKQLQNELGSRNVEVGELRAEVQATRAHLHTLQEAQAKLAMKDLVAAAATDPELPPDIAQALALDHARRQLRSELAWTKAKMVIVCHMASGLRAKLAAAQEARVQAELESMCVEAFWLEQGLLDQRAFAAAFDATFVQVKRIMTSTQQALAELRRQLLAPALSDLPHIAEQVDRVAAALQSWQARFAGRQDQGCQADPLAELASWQRTVLSALPAARPTSPPPLQHVSAIIVQVYAHRVRQLPLQGPQEPRDLLDNVFEALAQFFCDRRGFSREVALSPTGPVVALLAGTRSHLQQPKQLLLGRLAGLVASGGSGSSGSLQNPAAWQFFVRLLCCLRALQGAGWETLVKDWVESEEGVPLPLQCAMDVLANLYNTDAPALLDTMRRGLVPLVRQARRGPAIDLDAFLLVLMNEYCDGSCPISPLALPRRLTNGSMSGDPVGAGSNVQVGMASTVSGVALAVGGSEAYAAAGVETAATEAKQQQQQQRNPMRKRIINLTAAADAFSLAGSGAAAGVRPRSAAALPEPGIRPQQQGGSIGGSKASLQPVQPGAAAGGAGGGGCTRSLHVLTSMHSLLSSNPALPVGLRSQLRASSPSITPSLAAKRK